MITIAGELIKSNSAISRAERQLEEYSSEAFIHVLVEICYELKVETPIWTLAEERLLEKNKEVLMALEDGKTLRISSTLYQLKSG